jgi:hypothetical protein
MYFVEGVPDDAVPFGIGACCPCGGGYISEIRRSPDAYACTTTDRRETHRHVGWPKLTYRVDGRDLSVLVVTDNELDAVSHFDWKPWKSTAGHTG